MLLSNKLVYSDRLQVGSRAVAMQKLVLPRPEGWKDVHVKSGEHDDGNCWIGDLVDPE